MLAWGARPLQPFRPKCRLVTHTVHTTMCQELPRCTSSPSPALHLATTTINPSHPQGPPPPRTRYTSARRSPPTTEALWMASYLAASYTSGTWRKGWQEGKDGSNGNDHNTITVQNYSRRDSEREGREIFTAPGRCVASRCPANQLLSKHAAATRSQRRAAPPSSPSQQSIVLPHSH